MQTTRKSKAERALQNLDELKPENADAIRDLINHFAAEGLSEVHQERTVYSLKRVVTEFSPEDFKLRDATEEELKQVVANLNRSDYAESTKHKSRSALKKFYKVENGGEHPDKVEFFSVHRSRKESTVSREDLLTEEELKRLFRSFTKIRDRAFAMVLYESAARPGELINRRIGDFSTNEKGDFIYLEGLKGTPDRTNQLVRSGRTLREWLSHHPLGGELGEIEDPSSPLWVKTEHQSCRHCGKGKQQHDDTGCEFQPDFADPLSYKGWVKRYKKACEKAEIPENKRRPYNLRHTRLTEVATFMGYEQLNKFAGWKPGSDRAKVYVHLNNDDVNKAIRDQYGLNVDEDEDQSRECTFCGTENESHHSECRQCGRPFSLKGKTEKEEKQQVLERLEDLDQKGVLEKLEKLEEVEKTG